jgi:Leucine-rich repeat (LRR) protein
MPRTFSIGAVSNQCVQGDKQTDQARTILGKAGFEIKGEPPDSLFCMGSDEVTDTDLRQLKFFPSTRSLSLISTPRITNTGIGCVLALKRLKDLTILRNKIDDDGTKGFESLQALESLDLSETRIGDGTLFRLRNLRSLRELSIRRTQTTDRGISYLKGLEELRILEVSGTRITDRALETLCGLRLEELFLLNCAELTDKGVKCLSHTTTLRLLWLPPDSGDDGIQALSSLSRLSNLAVGKRTRNPSMDVIIKMANMERLTLSDSLITDQGLRGLDQLKKLKMLNLDGTRITDAGLPALKQLLNLESLTVEGTGITAAGVAKLRMALPKTSIR